MEITATRGDDTVYHQKFDDGKTLTPTVAFLMSQSPGTALGITILNNGQEMIFNHDDYPIASLIRKANGIVSRAKATTTA